MFTHLNKCCNCFVPPLNEVVDIKEYSQKLHKKSVIFEAWLNDVLIGCVAAYFSDVVYITNVSVLKEYYKLGITTVLLNQCIEYTKHKDIQLEVNKNNVKAICLYKKVGFIENGYNNKKIKMLYKVDFMKSKYFYGFDYDVMHPYMLKSFIPFFVKGNVLELGSYRGEFTQRLFPYFDDITCVEVSDDAIEVARKGFSGNLIHSSLETAILPTKYNNIIMTHVLEHIDDPVLTLKRINDEWLTNDGRLFLVCPNANAPSRQIAVKMGLIDHNSAVTPSEKEHGHRRTYTLDTLERDVIRSGLSVVHRSGIFFKALANFQWDKLLNTDIISSEYLDGCFSLGQQYPDFCASIFFVCERGKE
jgi:2-polyprenyl-3-methyl-5-hydroxy-6-metoxy-1,4-benzoquinol methylase